MYFWLVGFYHARAIWWRDPSHRLSNLFIRGLKGVKNLRNHVSDIMLLHKFRRAPYGGGRFFKELKETIALVLSRTQLAEALIEPFITSIAYDHGCAPDFDSVTAVLRDFCRMSLGPRVEMRRWFTFIDMAEPLLRIWNVMLLGLWAIAILDGRDPWELCTEAATRDQTATRGAGPNVDDAKVKEFSFKTECFKILLSSVTQGVLKSIQVVYSRTRSHQAWVALGADRPGRAVKHLLFWAHPTKYLEAILVPSVQEALSTRGKLATIGFTESVDKQPDDLDLISVRDLDEQQEILRAHLFSVFALAREWWLYERLPQCPPWSYVRMLHPTQAERLACVEEMKRVFNLFLRLEASNHAMVREFLATLHFRVWPVVREPLELSSSPLDRGRHTGCRVF